LRIEGKTSPADLKRLVEDRLRQGVYHVPGRPGIAYMVSPIITAYHGAGSKEIMTVAMPHLMFYAPKLAAADFGGGPPRGTYPYVFDQGPLGYMIQNIGDAEKARILAESKDLLKELCAFRVPHRIWERV